MGGEDGMAPGAGNRARQVRRLASAVVREAARPRALPVGLLLLTVAGGAWAQDGSPRVAWETFASNGVVLAFVLLALRFLHKGLTELRAELRTEIGNLRAELGTVQETLSAHGERLGRIESAQEATAAELSDLRTTMNDVWDTVHASAERLAWIEGAIDRRLKPAHSDAAAARSADPVPAA